MFNGGSAVGTIAVGTTLDSSDFTNSSTGTISGLSYGIDVYYGSARVVNSGMISGGTGVEFAAGPYGILTNSGTIIGGTGVKFAAGQTATLTNSGTIIGGNGTAVAFADSGSHKLTVDPGAVFAGAIYGGNTLANAVLELAAGASAGTITGLGTSVTNFTSLVFDAGAYWTVSGNDSANGLGGLGIIGFNIGDTIDLTGFVAAGETFDGIGLVLNDARTGTATLAIQGNYFSTANFVLAGDGSGGTDITVQALPPPVISGTEAGQTVADNATLQPFSGVTITDPNANQSETVIIFVDGGNPTDAHGTLSGAGLTKAYTGTYSLTAASPAAATTAIEALVFTPAAHLIATTRFRLDVTDTLNLGASDDETSVVTTAVNDAPAISGTVGSQAVADNSTLSPFTGVTITDPDIGATETATITLTDGTLTDGGPPSDAGGTLSGTGLTKTGAGTYTLAAGSPGAVTTELNALVFTPAAQQMVPGGTSTTEITLSLTDGLAGTPLANATTSVVTTATEIVPCFAAGTGIATARGAVAVERLREGDMLLTVSDQERPVQWIGRRVVDCHRHIWPERVRPIRIAAHAFGENRPSRVLRLSPDHSVFVADVLTPVKHLVNGTTVTQIDVKTVTYYHIELSAHDVVLAEGLPAETYLETGGRCAFENGGGAVQLNPDFAPDEARVGMVWQNFGYAPLIGSDGQLERVCWRLACQRLMLGYEAGGASQPTKRGISEPRRA